MTARKPRTYAEHRDLEKKAQAKRRPDGRLRKDRVDSEVPMTKEQRAESTRRSALARQRAMLVLAIRYDEECYALYRLFRDEIDRERGPIA